MANRYYRNAPIIDNKYYGIPNFVYANFDDIPFRELTIAEGDRLDCLVEMVYGDSKLWRAVAIYNDIGYFFELLPGDVIKLPIDINLVLARI